MSSFQAAPKQYDVSVASTDIPSSFLPVQAPRPVLNNVRQVVVQCNTGNAISAGSRMEFALPATAYGYLKSGSVFLRGSVTLAGGATWNFGIPDFGASALINRATLQINGIVAERKDLYHLVGQIEDAHATSEGYFRRDRVLLDRPKGDTANTDATVSFAIPVKLELLRCGYNLPLWALAPGSVVVSFDTNVLSEAIYDSAGASTGYTINSPQLVFDMVDAPAEMIQALKAEMAMGKSYNIPFTAFRTSAVADATENTINLAMNCSSLKAVFWFARNKVQANYGPFNRGTTQNYARLYLDSQLQNNTDLSDTPTQYAMLNAALGKIDDPSLSSCHLMAAATNWVSDFYAGAVGTRVCFDAGYGFTGKPCSTVALNISKTGGIGGTQYAVVCLDNILVIQGDGSINILQ